MKRLYGWRQHYVEAHPHILTGIGFAKGFGMELLMVTGSGSDVC